QDRDRHDRSFSWGDSPANGFSPCLRPRASAAIDLDDLKGAPMQKMSLVTGASRGIGLEFARLLDAEQQLFPAENTLAQKRLARLDALVAPYTSLGGGWSLQSKEVSSGGSTETATGKAALEARAASATLR